MRYKHTVNEVSVPFMLSLYTMPYWKMKNLRLRMVSAILEPKLLIWACRWNNCKI